jgi:hypothetical protein
MGVSTDGIKVRELEQAYIRTPGGYSVLFRFIFID